MELATDLKTELCGIPLAHPVMNAAGTCKLTEDVRQFAELTGVSAILLGSITMERRAGNPLGLDALIGTRAYSLNKLQLPNPGLSWYRANLPEIKEIAERAGKPLIVSVAGYTPREFAFLVAAAAAGGADAVELDFGSMTVHEESGRSHIITFDPQLIRDIFQQIQRRTVGIPIGVKPSPIPDPGYLAEVAELLVDVGADFVTTSNTFPNGSGAFGLDIGYAGVGGPVLKPIALGQAKQFREHLPDRIHVIGVGGIESMDDVLDYESVGVNAVQLATAHFRERKLGYLGNDAFDTIVSDLRKRQESLQRS